MAMQEVQIFVNPKHIIHVREHERPTKRPKRNRRNHKLSTTVFGVYSPSRGIKDTLNCARYRHGFSSQVFRIDTVLIRYYIGTRECIGHNRLCRPLDYLGHGNLNRAHVCGISTVCACRWLSKQQAPGLSLAGQASHSQLHNRSLASRATSIPRQALR